MKLAAKWFWDNRQWLFSGVAVSVIVIIFERCAPSAPRIVPPTTALVASGLSASQIHKEWRSARPFQQATVAKSFEGAPVDWTLPLFTVTPFTEKRVFISLDAGDTTVLFILPEEQCASLRLLDRGALIRVRGVISEVDSLIRLKDVSLVQ